jgi:hypothetical protein
MASSKVPADVRDFVVWFLPSVEHLEVFMTLHRHPARSWSPHEMAAELHIPEPTAEDVLERLARDNFLEIKISNEIMYRFNPQNPALADAAQRCADFYARHRSAVMNLV